MGTTPEKQRSNAKASSDRYDLARLARCNRELVALTTLPAIWSGRNTEDIAEELADTLYSMLRLQHVQVCLQGSESRPLYEATRGRGKGPSLPTVSTDGPRGDEPERDLHSIRIPINHDAELGYVIVGSSRADFPDELDSLTLEVAANQAAAAIRQSRLLKQAQDELLVRQRVEEALRETEQRFTRFMHHLPGLAWIKDSQGRYVYANDSALTAFGVTREQLYGSTDQAIFPPEVAAQFQGNDQVALDGGQGISVIETLQQADGIHHSIVSKFPIPIHDSREPLIGGIAVDITELVQAEESLRRHQGEIESLNIRLQRSIAETHHRVKNNLQVISALAEMPVLDGREVITATDLHRIRMHIQALAAIHELLTIQVKAGDVSDTISATETLGRLLMLVEQTLRGGKVRSSVQDFRIQLRQATGLAVVVNELISNSFKHGADEVEVSLSVEGDTVRLSVLDNGPGFPEGFNPLKKASTGLELVESVSRWDLGGTTRYTNPETGGAEVTVTFPRRD